MPFDAAAPTMIERIERALVLLAYLIELDGDLVSLSWVVSAPRQHLEGGSLSTAFAQQGYYFHQVASGSWQIDDRD
jgi:hypothetical protein